MYLDEVQMLIPIMVAFFLGAIIGWQREKQGKWAGPRTYALVSGGSALFTLLSITAFGTNMANVAAGIVTGIGFLGAGTILRREDRVVGLTTAAGLWMAAAIGMACGLQYYILGAITSILVLLLLMFNDQKFKKTPTVRGRIR